jgi:hypothetical protein
MPLSAGDKFDLGVGMPLLILAEKSLNRGGPVSSLAKRAATEAAACRNL